MSTISEKLIVINNTKHNIRDAIIERGVLIPEDTLFTTYPDYIATISSTYIGDGVDLWLKYAENFINALYLPSISGSIESFPDVIYDGNGADVTDFTNIFVSGTKASASDTYGATNIPSRVVDNNTSTFWETRATLPQWWQYDFGAGNAVSFYGVRVYTINSVYSRFFCEIFASNNLVDWVVISNFSTVGASTSWENFYQIASFVPYRYYRFNVFKSATTILYIHDIQVSSVAVGSTVLLDRYSTSGVVTIRQNPYTRSGYTFTGWNTTSSGTGIRYSPGDSFNLTDPINLYAQWEAI